MSEEAAARPQAGPVVRELERLWPAPSVWIFIAVVAAGFGLVAAPFGATVMAVAGVVTFLVMGVPLVVWAPVVGVDGDTFVAGRARVPVTFLGTPEVLDAAGMRHARGPGLDARAYLCLRGWVGPGLRVPVTDPADPVPYWLVSSRRPHRHADALERARR